jgi:basic membrane protein A and related proteins
MRGHRRFALAAVVGGLALGVAACGSSSDSKSSGSASASASAATSSGGKAAFIGVAPVTQGNWDPAGFKAFTDMAKKYGLKASNQESVGYDQGAAVLRRLARSNDLVISHSSGYEAAALEVAPDFPKTWFIVFSDLSTTKGLPNVAGWAVNWNQYGYMAGASACFAAKARGGNGVGHVNSQPIPAFARYAAGVKAGAEANGCKFQTRWTNSFSDVAKAKQAALSMIASGAEVITSSADTADEGSRDAAVEKNKLFIANYAPATSLAPKNTMTSIVINMEQAYDEMGKLFTAKKLQAKAYPVDIENGGLSYEPFSNVDAKVKSESEAVLKEIKDGKIQIDSKATLKP